MAVEIKELVIKAVVADGEGGGSGGDSDREQMIQQCVDQVLKILKQTNNR